MTTTVFTAGTAIASPWLNDANSAIYKAQSGLTGSVNRTALSKFSDVVSVKDFGATGDGVTNDTTALALAAAYATANNRALYFPSGTYLWTPTAYVLVDTKWFGETVYDTTIVINTSYVGESFRVSGTGSMEEIQIRYGSAGTTKTAGTKGIYVSDVTASGFTGHQAFRKVWVFGFAKAWDIGNVFLVTMDSCRGEFGTIGVNCTPDSSAGNGYATTLMFLNCSFADNTQNWNIVPTLQIHSLSIIGGATERPTTTTSQFTKVRNMTITDHYCEGSNTVIGFTFTDCTVTITSMYLNTTGGIAIGTNTNITLDGIITATATDIFTGGDGTQNVIIRNSSFPAAGNILTFLNRAIENSTINGTTYPIFTDAIILGKGLYNRSKVVVNNNASATYAVPAGCSYVGFTGTNVTSVAFTLPTAADTLDGFIITIFTQGAISVAATWTSSGATFKGAPATISAGGIVSMIFDRANNWWMQT